MSNGWGGRRTGSGRKRKQGPRLVVNNMPATPKAKEPAFSVDMRAALRIIEESKALARAKNRAPEFNPFQIPAFPPKALPPKKLQIAMDSGISWAGDQWAGSIFASVGAEGLMFLGYPYLAELAQRPEYRVISETIATEMTRRWIKFKSTGADDGEDKAEKIKQLTDEFDRLQVRDYFKELAIQDGFYGRSHLFLDFGRGPADSDTPDEELKTDIGTGRDETSKGKVEKGSLRALRTVEAVWTYPTTYNAINPLRFDWYRPQVWYVMGKEIHCSRLPTFIGHPVPDLLKPAYSFGGLSLSQMAKPYVDIWLKTRESVGELIHAFSVMVLMTDMQSILQPTEGGGVLTRVAMFNTLRDNQGTFVVNKATEDFKNVSASLAGLHELQAQAQELMMSVARIPAVKFTGISPTGLNASSEGEMRAFYDTVGAYQEAFFRPNLTKVMHFAMLSLWGEVDPEITFDFEPLWALSEKEEAEVRKIDAETAQVHIDTGVLDPAEERKRVATDKDTLYEGLDAQDVPNLREEEEQGLEPIGGRPQPLAEAGPGLGEGEEE